MPHAPKTSPFLSAADAARDLGLTPRRVQMLAEEGKLRHERIGRTLMVYRDGLDAVRGLKRGRPKRMRT